jgi:hypothetical protein
VRDIAKSGFGLVTLGRRISPVVMNAVKMTTASKIHRGTGLENLDKLIRASGYSSKPSNEPCPGQHPRNDEANTGNERRYDEMVYSERI